MDKSNLSVANLNAEYSFSVPFIEQCDICINNKILKPKDDLTPIELWNIQKWINTFSSNYPTPSIKSELWDYAVELKIDRHFEDISE